MFQVPNSTLVGPFSGLLKRKGGSGNMEAHS